MAAVPIAAPSTTMFDRLTSRNFATTEAARPRRRLQQQGEGIYDLPGLLGQEAAGSYEHLAREGLGESQAVSGFRLSLEVGEVPIRSLV